MKQLVGLSELSGIKRMICPLFATRLLIARFIRKSFWISFTMRGGNGCAQAPSAYACGLRSPNISWIFAMKSMVAKGLNR
jgi:hypothetical protein